MARKNKGYQVDEVLKFLNRKNDVLIKGRTIFALNGNGKRKRSDDMGNGAWGRVDFLVNHCGYSLSFTSKFPGDEA